MLMEKGGNFVEEWKPIQDFENYLVSNTGKVKNCKTNKLLYINDKGSKYYHVDLWKNNKRKRMYLHRLVATAFVFNSDNKPAVNHIDANKYNNNAYNLEWVTYKENTEHAVKKGLINFRNNGLKMKGKKKVFYKVYTYDLNTKEIKVFDSVHELFEIYKRNNVYKHLKNGNPYKNVIFSKDIKSDWERDTGGDNETIQNRG